MISIVFLFIAIEHLLRDVSLLLGFLVEHLVDVGLEGVLTRNYLLQLGQICLELNSLIDLVLVGLALNLLSNERFYR